MNLNWARRSRMGSSQIIDVQFLETGESESETVREQGWLRLKAYSWIGEVAKRLVRWAVVVSVLTHGIWQTTRLEHAPSHVGPVAVVCANTRRVIDVAS